MLSRRQCALPFRKGPCCSRNDQTPDEGGASEEVERLICRLQDINALKFGSFTLKSGLISPFYIDLRVIVSYPDVLAEVSELMWRKVAEAGATFDVVCGVPYTALPIATAMSLQHAVPMVMRRKEIKNYGTMKAIEGAFHAGQTCLLVEDLVTSGASVLETLGPIASVGLTCRDVVVLIDREQGGARHLAGHGLRLHSLVSITQVARALKRRGRLEPSLVETIARFVRENPTAPPAGPVTMASAATSAAAAGSAAAGGVAEAAGDADGARVAEAASPPGVLSPPSPSAAGPLPYEVRAERARNPVARRLLALMARKQTNLCVAADVGDCAGLLALARQVGRHICVLKTHVDALSDFSEEAMRELRKVADDLDFLLFEDRKFADIGNTVLDQYTRGIFGISQWADMLTVHALPGPGVLEPFRQTGDGRQCGVLLLAEMSSAGALTQGAYTEACVRMAATNTDVVMGLIAQRPAEYPSEWWGPAVGSSGGAGAEGRAILASGMVCMTPGVKLQKGGDAMGQQYNTPEAVIKQGGTSVIIVGRGIVQASDPAKEAAQYREAGWAAYLSTLKS
eukprot:jgi/Mesvir1/12655/Mv02207-RA.1